MELSIVCVIATRLLDLAETLLINKETLEISWNNNNEAHSCPRPPR